MSIQNIRGVEVYVVDFNVMPTLPITGEGEERAYAQALTSAIASGLIAKPGKYGIELTYQIYTINEEETS